MSGWWSIARDRAVRGEASVLVTVCNVAGSAPREPGTKMLVWADGQSGTVGGGNLEFVIAGQARKLLGCGDAYRFQSYPLGPLLGQCCGGRVGVLLERIDGASLDWLEAAGAAEEDGAPYAIHSALGQGRVVKHIVRRGAVASLSQGGESVILTARDGARIDPAAAKVETDGLSLVEHVDPRPCS